jgi:hypothetical protein
MSVLLISEFPGLAGTQANEGAVPILPVPATLESQVTVSSIPVLFGPFQPSTAFVELCAQTTCSILFGLYGTLTTGMITTGSGRINANERVIRRIPFSPQYGGASAIPQSQPLYAAVICSSN